MESVPFTNAPPLLPTAARGGVGTRRCPNPSGLTTPSLYTGPGVILVPHAPGALLLGTVDPELPGPGPTWQPNYTVADVAMHEHAYVAPNHEPPIGA